jgi:DNA-binding FadR family transcriptional regulator
LRNLPKTCRATKSSTDLQFSTHGASGSLKFSHTKIRQYRQIIKFTCHYDSFSRTKQNRKWGIVKVTGRASDSIVKTITERIHSGMLADGDLLPAERDLMAEFEISRTVAREAVRILSSQGLITAKPRHRPVIRKAGFEAAFDATGSIVGNLLQHPGGVHNLFDTRILVEAALVRVAAQSAGKKDILDLKTALAANGAAVDDSDQFYQTDQQFHAVLYNIPGNPVYPAIHRAYTTWLAPQWGQMPRIADRNRINFASHTAIVDAILSRDPDAAEAALRSHLADAWDQVRLTFGDI